jgi:uncharacterized membrane protein
MTTPIIMLVLLVAPYAVVRILSALTHRDFSSRDAGGMGLTLLFIFTGIAHFAQPESMSHMLPPWVPERVLIIYVTGILEFSIATGFMARKSRRLTGWLTATMLVLFFPANIYTAINHIPMGGHAWGPVYLLIRAPLQLVILLWVYWFTIKQSNPTVQTDTRQVTGT